MSAIHPPWRAVAFGARRTAAGPREGGVIAQTAATAKRKACGRSGGGVVVDDAPAFGQLLQDQREQPAGVLALERQLPAAADQGIIAAERLDLQLAEGELAHFAAVGLVTLAVAVECGLPAAHLRL